MENNIIVKEVNFMGNTLVVAQDENKQVWVGVKWVCEGIGLSDGQIKSERLKLKSDLVLREGGRNFVLPTKGDNQAVFCIMIDFLPLWLAKISITPRMKELTPNVVEKLVAYQLKAKDVLAAAFLPQYVQPTQPTQVFTQTNMTSMLNQFYCCLESTLCSELKTRFNESIPQIISMLSANQPLLPVSTTPIKAVEHIQTPPTFTGCPEGKDWKQWVYYMVDTYIMTTGSTKNRKEILSEIYAYLCKNYGMVSDQLAKEYRRNHSGFGKVSTISLIESNKK